MQESSILLKTSVVAAGSGLSEARFVISGEFRERIALIESVPGSRLQYASGPTRDASQAIVVQQRPPRERRAAPDACSVVQVG